MKELSPDARTIVAAGRTPGMFTRADRERIKRGVLLRVATVGAATASAGTAAGMSLATKLTLVAAVTAALGGGSVALWVSQRAATPLAPSATAGNSYLSSKPRRAVPALATASQDLPPTPSALSADPRRTDSTRKPSIPLAPASSSANTGAPQLGSELEVLRQAREDLRSGLPGNAYQRLIEYDRRHGKGALAQERQALSTIALCQWRPGNEAQRRAQEFLRNAPQSPLANRVRLVCEQSNASTDQLNDSSPNREPKGRWSARQQTR